MTSTLSFCWCFEKLWFVFSNSINRRKSMVYSNNQNKCLMFQGVFSSANNVLEKAF